MSIKILIACEESQRVTIEMRRLGHEAYSCDIQEPSGGHPEWHIHGDALNALRGETIQTMDGEIHVIGKWDADRSSAMYSSGGKRGKVVHGRDKAIKLEK